MKKILTLVSGARTRSCPGAVGLPLHGHKTAVRFHPSRE